MRVTSEAGEVAVPAVGRFKRIAALNPTPRACTLKLDEAPILRIHPRQRREVEEVDRASRNVVVEVALHATNLDGLVATLDRGAKLASREPTLRHHALHQLLAETGRGHHEEVLRTGHRVLARAAIDPLDQVPDVRFGRLVYIGGVRSRDHAGGIPDAVGRSRDVVQAGIAAATVRDVDQTVHRHVERRIRRRRLHDLVRRRHTRDRRTQRQGGVVAAVRDGRDGRTTQHRISRRRVEDGDVVAHREEEGTLSSASQAVRGRHDDRRSGRSRADQRHDAVRLVVQGLLHEELGGVLDLFHRLGGDGRKGCVLALRANEGQTVDLTGGVGTDDTDVALHFGRGRVRREVPTLREGGSRRTARYHIEEHVVATPPHIAGATSFALLQLGKERRDKVLHLLTKLRVDVLEQASQLCIGNNCWVGHMPPLCVMKKMMPTRIATHYPPHRQRSRLAHLWGR